jgi:phosphoesterase RecJ-like protein
MCAEYGSFSKETPVELCIDHHYSNTMYAENTYLDDEAAAAGEAVYDVLREMQVKITKEIAECIYVAVATDTGCFKFTNTTSRTHRIAGELMAYDFSYGDINYQLFDLKSKGRIELEQRILRDIEFAGDDKIAIVWLTLDIMNEFSDRVDTEDLNGLASLPRQIEGVILGVTVKQKNENLFKVSMRSTEQINAAGVCGVFGGGGHARAAGCTIEGSLQFVKVKLLPVLEKAVEQL